MENLEKYLLIGVGTCSICCICISICFITIKDYYYSYFHKVDFENITNNILSISDEETGSKVEYMKARPII